MYLNILTILRGKKDATTFSRQACLVNCFTLLGFENFVKDANFVTFLLRSSWLLKCPINWMGDQVGSICLVHLGKSGYQAGLRAEFHLIQTWLKGFSRNPHQN